MDLSDEQLVERVASGDRAAFTVLVGRHQQRLLALVSRTLNSRAAADDVVQDVFTRAWVNAPSWHARANSSYAAWLSRVAMNLSIDQIRKRRGVALDAIDDPADPAPAADQTMADRERAAQIRAAVATLPERQRMAIALTYDADLSNREGAAAMNTSIGAFELLLVRARKALRLALRDPQ